MSKLDALHASELTDAQRRDIAAFLAKPAPARKGRKFAEAWKAAKALLLIGDELNQPLSKLTKGARTHLERQASRMAVRITPAKKRKAIEDRAHIKARFRELIRQDALPDNRTTAIALLRKEGTLAKRGTKPSHQYSDTTVRTILRKVTGIRGQPGRPRQD